jgi:hypothetical protein
MPKQRRLWRMILSLGTVFSRYCNAPQALLCGQVPRCKSECSATNSTGGRLPQFTMGSGEAPLCTIPGSSGIHLIWSSRIYRIESIQAILPASFPAQLIFNPLLLKPSHWPFFWSSDDLSLCCFRPMCALDYGKAETHIVLLLSPQKSDRSTDVQRSPRTADAN